MINIHLYGRVVWSLLYVLFLFFQWQCMYEYRPSAPNQLVDLYRRRTTRIYNYKYIFYIWTDSWLFLSLSVVRSFRFHTLSLNLNVVLGCLPVFCLVFFFIIYCFLSFVFVQTNWHIDWSTSRTLYSVSNTIIQCEKQNSQRELFVGLARAIFKNISWFIYRSCTCIWFCSSNFNVPSLLGCVSIPVYWRQMCI